MGNLELAFNNSAVILNCFKEAIAIRYKSGDYTLYAHRGSKHARIESGGTNPNPKSLLL
jgi:hypothetical protein